MSRIVKAFKVDEKNLLSSFFAELGKHPELTKEEKDILIHQFTEKYYESDLKDIGKAFIEWRNFQEGKK